MLNLAASVVERRAYLDSLETVAKLHDGEDDFYGDKSLLVCPCCGEEVDCPTLVAIAAAVGVTP